jgi:hypothetical protein
MGTLTRIYWTRFFLGIVAGFVCTLYNIYVESGLAENLSVFLTGFSLALLIYLLSYYAFKHFYLAKVEKLTKLFTTGIGIYFISWIVFWTLFWTIYISTFVSS